MALRDLNETPPTYTTEVEAWVEVEIEPEQLEEAGWVYVGTDELPTTEHVLNIVRRWHEDVHSGPFRWCTERPCDELRGRD